jgi:RNA polymerase sigma-70 factor (ECF subfamily)
MSVQESEEFERLTGPFRQELLAYCYRMLGSVQDAEDQVQETLLRAWRGYGGFEGRSSMRTWLYRIAALQYLPARQRAVLILRDVLGWRAAEVAGLLGTSVPAVNSALQRAREHLEVARPAEDEIGEPDTRAERDLVGQYAAAFENADMAGLVALLREDAVLEMPPLPGWFRGRAAVARFLGTRVMRLPCAAAGGPPRPPGEFKMVPTAANGQPAFAAYLRDQAGVYRAHAIQVLTPSGPGLARIVSFNDPRLFEMFGLPETTDRSA